ncbi:MAG: biopolymer transporter ExbD [Campylobacterales bacterium]|nr:biopolymer transporter ExbD [Campylobacterales bacterium]
MTTNNAYEDNEISEINMTPFVDIVLVVLVIFMATATF